MKRILSAAEIFLIVLIAIIPLFPSFPYRLNSFLSWEGAYRMSQGQVPYRDFGIPVGYMYWVIPAIFFKVFGVQMITLIKAQVFINLLSGFAFRSILRSIQVIPSIRFAGILLFCLSFSLPNYWPWYNHTVIVYEFIALAFLLYFIFNTAGKWHHLWLVLSGIFVFFSFFTKQDGGGLAFLLCLAILTYNSIIEKKWIQVPVFVGSVLATGIMMILPFTKYKFGYWFNHGQSPHTSRISITDILREFLADSQWLKFYLLIITILLAALVKDWKTFFYNKRQMVFLLLTLGIIAEAAVFQVTSYLPVDNNIFYHAFAAVFILSLLSTLLPINFNSWKTTIICTAGVLLWWSQAYWKYIDRFFLPTAEPSYGTTTYGGYKYADVVNRNTYMIELDTTDIPLNQWRVPQLNAFKKILMPGPTADGIERLMKLDLVKENKDLKVLNMSELTPLAVELPFTLEKGSYYPLWYHKGVGMFDKETNLFVDRVRKNYYDLVIFEYVPYSNNFYPFQVRAALQQYYKKIDSFPVPRKPSSHGWIELYVKR